MASIFEYELNILGCKGHHAITDQAANEIEVLVAQFVDGKYEECLENEMLKTVWQNGLPCRGETLEDFICDCIRKFLNGDDRPTRELAILIYGASLLNLFVQNNWTGPPSSSQFRDVIKNFFVNLPSNTNYLSSHYDEMQSLHDHAVKLLSLEGTIYHKVTFPEYLWLARIVLCLCSDSDVTCQTLFWWSLRCNHIHQLVLDEKSPTLHLEALNYISRISSNELLMTNDNYRRLQIEFNLEASIVLSIFFETTKSKEHLNSATKIAGLDLSLTGALGKRTYFQEDAKAQLKLNIKREFSDSNSSNFTTDVPKDILINDGVRREKISFLNDADNEAVNLSSEEQAIILNTLLMIQKTSPVHKLVDEELMAYLNAVLSQPQVWSVQTKALCLRCQIESKRQKSYERSMMQIQELINTFNAPQPNISDRMYLFYAVSMSPIWKLQQRLADLFLKLGVINSAVEVYLRLEMWDKVIFCYQLLERKSQAEEIIRQQLRVKETPNLWCSLGDVTDDPECYEKAWFLSDERSARAQKCLGLFHFNKKEYKTCIPYFKRSLELNHLQLSVSSLLGYAAMQAEEWDAAASAYRQCVNLETDAWNNLANVYLKLKQKTRAWKAFQEALRCDFDNWRIWENYMVVSVDCRAFEDGISAYHRLLELKEKFVDIEILSFLTKAVIEDLPDNGDAPSSRLKGKLLQLFGRLTAQITSNSRVWDMYADLVLANSEKNEVIMEKAIQLRQRAQRLSVQQAGWEKNEESCQSVVDLSLRLADDFFHYWHFTPDEKKRQSQLSANLMLKGVVLKLNQYQQNNLNSEAVTYLTPLIQKLNEKIDQVK